ncbi:hypothetical protein JCM15831A_19630 [Asaia astilbis]
MLGGGDESRLLPVRLWGLSGLGRGAGGKKRKGGKKPDSTPRAAHAFLSPV